MEAGCSHPHWRAHPPPDLLSRLSYFLTLVILCLSISVPQVISVAHVVLDPFPVSSSILTSLQAFSQGVPVVTMPSDRLGGRFVLALYQMMEYGFGNETVIMSGNGGEGRTGGNGRNERKVREGIKGGMVEKGGTGSKGREGTKGSKESKESGGSGGKDRAPVPPLSVSTALVVSTPSEYVSTALSIALNPALRSRHTTEILGRIGSVFDSAKRREEAVADWRSFLFAAVAKVKNRTSRIDLLPLLSFLLFFPLC